MKRSNEHEVRVVVTHARTRTHTHCHNFKVIKWTCQRVACIKKCSREREDGFFVTNIATVLHDHRREPRCSVTAEAI